MDQNREYIHDDEKIECWICFGKISSPRKLWFDGSSYLAIIFFIIIKGAFIPAVNSFGYLDDSHPILSNWYTAKIHQNKIHLEYKFIPCSLGKM